LSLREDQIIKNLKVRQSGNAMKIGLLTGRTKKIGDRVLAEVDFGPAERSYKRINLLEPVLDYESPKDLVLRRRFGSLRDFRARITAEKVGGDLTDIFYSLGQDRTAFYEHQFLPVMKFIQSMPGRLLIADEVGLGKTIEAAYIWKEVQARSDAYTWLIICPSVLKDKWKEDLSRLFRIDARIVSGKELTDEFKAIVNGDKYKERVLITGLESIRIHKGLIRFLENYSEVQDKLVDLITVDEAHYLRNSLTKSHQIIESLRSAAEHLLLLSATPIQTDAKNLFNLLKLLEPEDFFDPESFKEQNRQNGYIVNAIRWLIEGRDINQIGEHLFEAFNLTFFKNNSLLEEILIKLSELNEADTETRYSLADELEKVSMFHRHINRTLKRDVLTNRVIREAHRVPIFFNDLELKIYEKVTTRLKEQGKNAGQANIFALMTRQRQMASSLPAAIRSWIRKNEELDESEQIWEDFGDVESENNNRIVPNIGTLSESEYLEILKHDSKYNVLKQSLDNILSSDPDTKIVLFSFFRETLGYLNERLNADGITNIVLRGGVGDKTSVIDEFHHDPSIRVLLSSEVGSEGVDLQFCRIIINYDLPWNPMRVEQRIGRIDRIGQKAEKIQIYNLVREDSIEENILYRLMGRIGIFEGSIGDLEDILGEEIHHLAMDFFNPDLNDEQLQRKGEQTINAVNRRRQIQNNLEKDAWQLSGLSDYLVSRIREKKELGHFIKPEDLQLIVTDFLSSHYPGSQIDKVNNKNELYAALSIKASSDLQTFINKNKIAAGTALIHNNKVLLNFDPQGDGTIHGNELITVRHPLIRWISRSILENHNESPTVLTSISSSLSGMKEGIYSFTIAFFGLTGMFRKRELYYSVVNLETGELFNDKSAELLIQEAIERGKVYSGSLDSISDGVLRKSMDDMEQDLNSRFEEFTESTVSRNDANAEQQLRLINLRADREIEVIKSTIKKLREEGKKQMIPANEGKIRKLEIWRNSQINKISNNRDADPEFRDIAAGIIVIEGDI